MKTFLGANVKTRRDMIRCPGCGNVQEGVVWLPDPPDAAMPFPVYSHFCSLCGYLILESEWDEVPAAEMDTPHVVVVEDDGHPD